MTAPRHPASRRPARAAAVLESVLDRGSFRCWDDPVEAEQPQPDLDQWRTAAHTTGADESVVTGRGTVGGRPIVVLVSEFAFLGGSIGRTAAGRIVAAVRRATAAGLPVLASTASGGTRMQEGTPAFVTMIDISRALLDHRAAGLPYLVHLRHPTTGGVYASWGSLGHVSVAEPGALIGFLGPTVHRALADRPLPPDVQRSESLVARGIVDAVAGPAELAPLLERILGLLLDPPGPSTRARRPGKPDRSRSAWAAIERTRRRDRIGIRDLLRCGSDATMPLLGGETGEREGTVLIALARLDGVSCVVVGHDRAPRGEPASLRPDGLREARRGMRLADELGLPLVTVIDTPGAELSAEAEHAGVAPEIAHCLATMLSLRVPTLALLLGQGAGGAALALLGARRVVAAERAWVTPLPPEGASVIVHGTVEHAAEVAERQRIRAVDLADDGTVHRVVPEPDDDTAAALAGALAAEIGHQLREMAEEGSHP